MSNATTAKHYHGWHEEVGPVLWWIYLIGGPPYSGMAHDHDWPFEEHNHRVLYWTPIPDVNEIEKSIETYADEHQDIIAEYPCEEGMGL